MDSYFEELKENGYTVIPNILSKEEIKKCYDLFKYWYNRDEENLIEIHKTSYPHGIFKGHQAGHQRWAWIIKTHPNIISFFRKYWGTDDLVVSFDGCCYIPKDWKKKDNCWTHTDKGDKNSDKIEIQALLALTSNKERTFRVYEKSHLLHKKYFLDRGGGKDNWHKIDPNYLEEIKDSKRVLDVSAGSLVVWDSRSFHQNQYGLPGSEERLVQYVCMFPASHSENSNAMNIKREKYFK